MDDASLFSLMLTALSECLVLVGIHSYLGLHVIRRKVIFVDLALAQLAVLGATVGIVSFGFSPSAPATWVFSLLFSFLGAVVFSLTRVRDERVPQEAIIGLVFAMAAAIAILLIASNDAKSLKKILTGTILFLDWWTIGVAAVVYSLIGVLHYLVRRPLLQISEDPEAARREGRRIWAWDLLFYLTFGVVISISVNTAGVLLVFVFLVGPAVLGMLITDRLLHQLLIGWGLGTVVSFLGLAFSYFANFPSGPSIVCLYGVVLVVCAGGVAVARSARRGRTAGRLAAGTAGVALLCLVSYVGLSALAHSALGRGDHDHHGSHHAGDHHEHAGHAAAGHAAPAGGAVTAEALLEKLQRAGPEELGGLLEGLTTVERALFDEAFERADGGTRLTLAKRMVELDRARGAVLLVTALAAARFPFQRSGTFEAVKALSGQDFGYDPDVDEQANGPALAAMRRWAASLGGPAAGGGAP